MKVRFAEISDLIYINHLSKQETMAIGFIPNTAYLAAITGQKFGKRWSNVCNDKLWVALENNEHVGFLLMSFGEAAKVNQICIQEDARKFARGKALLNTGINYARSIGKYDFAAAVAEDLEANLFWHSMGWSIIGFRNGRAYKNTWKDSSGRKINLYKYQINSLFWNTPPALGLEVA